MKNKNIALFLVIFVGALALMVGPRFFNSDDGVGQTATIVLSDLDAKKGNPSAKVTLIEFSDFQCPACRAYFPIIKQVSEEYKNEVLFAYKHFPLTNIHPFATLAGQAAEAAGRQGKFWEMHDRLFEEQPNWSQANGVRELFVGYAQDLGLDIEKFQKDLEDPVIAKKITDDFGEGLTNGVNGTPTFFLNGTKLGNIQHIDEFRALIDEELSRVGGMIETVEKEEVNEVSNQNE